MGHRRAELTTLRRRYVQPESAYWLGNSTRTLTANYNVLLFQDFQIMRYLLGIFYKVQWVSSRILIKRYGIGYVSVSTTIFRLLVRPWETLFFSRSVSYLFFRLFVCVQKVVRFFFYLLIQK